MKVCPACHEVLTPFPGTENDDEPIWVHHDDYVTCDPADLEVLTTE